MGERIGFIGLGIMGKPMAGNLLRAGIELVVHSRSPAPVDELVTEGAARASGPRELAAKVEVVITMLPDSPDVELVMFGEDGVERGIRPGSLVIDMSTIRPSEARRFAERLAARDVAMLDAPVSGGERGAIDGTLSIMVGGAVDAFRRALPVLEVVGRNVTHVGRSGAGQVAKACNQLIVGATIQAVAEALVLAASAGVDPVAVRHALLGGFAGSKVLEGHGQRMLDGDFGPGFRSALHLKDARIVLETAAEFGSPVPSFAVVGEALERLIETGRGDLDHAALVTLLENEAGAQLSGTMS
ncbi:MAG TPA: NAD(P)-binding domain-containing protein [Actinomycetota bacterium]|nr:NAD(P)-binding domain-containing protein [Actinomycetota bacterium]